MADAEQNAREQERCRLVLVANAAVFENCETSVRQDGFGGCVGAGDIASVIFHDGGLDEAVFQRVVEPLVKISQENGVAAVVCDQSRIAGRVNADGLQLGQDPSALAEAVGKHHPAMMVGAGNVKTRHNALVIGELQPDYLMFGKPGGDTRPDTNPKNLALGAWWSALVEIPCIVLGGTSVNSVVEVAKTGAEFVALGEAVFASQSDVIDFDAAVTAIINTNRLLDDHAPRFELED